MRRLGFDVTIESRQSTLHFDQQTQRFSHMVKIAAVPLLVAKKLTKSGQEMFPVINRLLEYQIQVSEASRFT